jgi:response regulator of citrate/malate metabolism
MPNEKNGRHKKKPKFQARNTPRQIHIDKIFKSYKEQFKTIAEASELLGLPVNTLHHYCRLGLLVNSQNFGNDWAVSRVDIDWWIENRKGKRGRPRKSDEVLMPRHQDIDRIYNAFKDEFKPSMEAAKAIGLSKNTIQRYCQDHILTNAQEFGRDWAVSRVDIDWWKENRKGKVGRPKKSDSVA